MVRSVQTVRPWEGDTHIYLLLGEPSLSSAQAVLQAAEVAKAILDENFADHSDYIESIEEKDSRKLAEQIATDVRSRIRGNGFSRPDYADRRPCLLA